MERLSIEDLRDRAGKLPRVSLTHLPTPLLECPSLGKHLGVRLFFKRDDLTTLACGGNKIRKLEFGIGEALASGCDVIVHGLAGQSNYCRQTAAAAAKCGLKCVLVLRKDHKTDGPPQGNLLLDHVFGAEVRMVGPEPGLQKQAKDALMEELKAAGHKAYRVGRHDEVLGAVAYALCMGEIIAQLEAVGVRADFICVTGQAGTQAGLVLGKRLLGFAGEVLGFNVMPMTDQRASDEWTAGVATEAAKLLGADVTITADEVHNTAAYAGEAYGTPTAACMEAMGLLGRTEGLAVGPVYTAKGLAGMIDYARTGKIAAGSTVVFVHTGGVPEIFAYNREVMDSLGRAT